MNLNRTGVAVAAALMLAVGGVGIGIFIPAALAQTTVTATSPDTTINVGQYLHPLVQALVAVAVTVITALGGWLTATITKKFGLEGTAAAAQIEETSRKLLHSALESAAGWVIMKYGDKLKDVKIDVKSPIIADAVNLVIKYAGDAVDKYGLSADDIAQKIIEKIGIMTASNPNATPSVTG